MKYKKQDNCVYHCIYHLVLSTKYRRKIFNDGIASYVEKQLKEIGKFYPEIHILEMNHEEDHLHLMLWIPPKMSIGQVVRIIKSNTARNLKGKFPFLKQVYWGTDSIWSGGYFVSTVGLNQEAIRKYIELQGREDAGQAQLEFK